MITKTLKTGIFIITVASFSFSNAQETVDLKKDNSSKMFNHIDANSDDVITLEEYKTARLKDASKEELVKKRYLSIDTDKNGTLNREEFSVFYNSKQKPKRVKNQIKVQEKKSAELDKKE
ncbi:EF-hand domain-containing protein [Winogradskyella sp. Asnod2-B02-A]|uniref:EF-hand domain-containing protein n=1 Tax=Winogradskyella sp. Asnod2-B02-A TaxID=3160583 RepID=UPI003864181F